jgi:hypothetical protein
MPATLPATLAAWRSWRKAEHEPRDVWTPLEPWLSGELGYTLFASTIWMRKPTRRKHKTPVIAPYNPNGFAFLSPHSANDREWHSFLHSDVR